MGRSAYITRMSKYLPNEPVSNDEMENILENYSSLLKKSPVEIDITLARGLNSARQQEDDQNNHEQTQPAAWKITPILAVRPGR